MKVTFNVPHELEETFIGRSQSELDLMLTQAFKNSDIRLVQNLCFDILSKVSDLSVVSTAVPTSEANRQVKQIKPAHKENNSKTSTSPIKDDTSATSPAKQTGAGNRRRKRSSIFK